MTIYHIHNYFSDNADYNEVGIDEELQCRLMFNILMIIDEEQEHLFKIIMQFNHIIQVSFFTIFFNWKKNI